MAKKSQTKARRNNTQVGSQVVNFYNHGTVNVDARQNNSVSPKSTYSYCTLHYSQPAPRPFTLKDQLEEEHPILGMVTPETIPTTEVSDVEAAKKSNKKYHPKKSIHWGWIGAGIAVGLGVATVIAKYYAN